MKSMASVNVLVTLLIAFIDLNLLASASRLRSRHHLHRRHERIPQPFASLFPAIHHQSERHKKASCEDILSDDLMAEIDGYRDVVEHIIRHVTENEMGETYRQLTEFVETFGPRYITTEALQSATHDRVTFLSGLVPGDVAIQSSGAVLKNRGATNVVLFDARYDGGSRTIFRAGYRIGRAPPTTQVRNFTAELLVVKSLEELESVSREVPRKVVLFDKDVMSVDEFLAFAHDACPRAEALGAVAVLLKTTNNPEHRGQRATPHAFEDTLSRIPVFEVEVADADFVARKSTGVHRMTVFVGSEIIDTTATAVPASNVIAEIRGRTIPDETLVVASHLDTWDAGQEFTDDAAGAAVTWRVLEVLKHLDLVARRSIRIALYTDETLGFHQYDKRLNDFRFAARATQFVLKSDSDAYIDVTDPLDGLSTSIKNRESLCIMHRTLQLFNSIGLNHIDKSQYTPDAEQWKTYGVPTASMSAPRSTPLSGFRTPPEPEDRVQEARSRRLDKATAFWAGLAYVFADLAVKFPQETE